LEPNAGAEQVDETVERLVEILFPRVAVAGLQMAETVESTA
jgi:hypothetical protein